MENFFKENFQNENNQIIVYSTKIENFVTNNKFID